MLLATLACATFTLSAQTTPSVVTTNRPIHVEARRTFTFSDSGVFASNEFDGGRLHDFYRTGPSTFTALLQPENTPINNSAWYAFKLWSVSNQTVEVRLTYVNGKHRYTPKISRDRVFWDKVEPASYTANTGDGGASVRLDIGPKPIYIAGQELFTSSDFHGWMEQMAKYSFVRSGVIGQSVRGKPIRKLEISEARRDAPALAIIGRQHPPEVTGTFALLAFVETITGDSDLAKRFRRNFKTVVVPMINPDGVDAGHWRHNVHGVDLNRDWGQFHQPETRAVREELLRLRKTNPIRFGLDFHSTHYDVFYTISAPRERDRGGEDVSDLDFTLAERWLDGVQARLPDYKVTVEPSAHRTSGVTMVSTAWMQRELRAPAVTYEVGDKTDRELIRKVARASAMVLMELLLGDGEAE